MGHNGLCVRIVENIDILLILWYQVQIYFCRMRGRFSLSVPSKIDKGESFLSAGLSGSEVLNKGNCLFKLSELVSSPESTYLSLWMGSSAVVASFPFPIALMTI